MEDEKVKIEVEKVLRQFLTLGINGEYFTLTDPAVIATRILNSIKDK